MITSHHKALQNQGTLHVQPPVQNSISRPATCFGERTSPTWIPTGSKDSYSQPVTATLHEPAARLLRLIFTSLPTLRHRMLWGESLTQTSIPRNPTMRGESLTQTVESHCTDQESAFPPKWIPTGSKDRHI